MAETVYIIDGHSQIYRAYYAPFRDLTSPSGEPTRATYVFCSMLMKFIADRRPKYLVMAMDGPTAGGHRRGLYAQYKATRPPMPQDLPPQIDRIRQIVQLLRVPILEAAGYEADDVIATLSQRLAGQQNDVVMISRDKDLDQLVGPHVVMYDPMKDETFDAAAIVAQKGYGPELAVEVQTLMGDAIDNIPGVPGVGPKTAAKLITQYGSVQGVVDHADELTPKLRDSVLASADKLAMSRQLVTLKKDVEVNISLDQMAFAGLPNPALRALFVELGFNRLLDQLTQLEKSMCPPAAGEAHGGAHGSTHGGAPAAAGRAAATNKPLPGIAGGLFSAEIAPAPQAEAGPTPHGEGPAAGAPSAVAAPHQPATPKPGETSAADFDYKCIDTLDALEALAKDLAGVRSLAVDTETTSPQPMWCEMVGMSLSWQSGRAFYLPVRGPAGSRLLDIKDIRRLIGPVLADPAVEKIGQNLKYDLLVLRGAGLPIAGKLFDTMVAAHVLDSTRMTYNLGALGTEFLNHRSIPIEDLIGRGKKQITMDMVACDTVAIYASEDADMTFRLAQVLREQLAAQGLTGLFENLEMPLLPVLAEMEWQGIRVDADVLRRMEGQLQVQADVLRGRIIAAAGREFNPDSTKQLAEVLFGDLKLPVLKKGKTAASTDSDVLEQLAVMHELPGLVLDYRKLTKLIGTYLSALAQCIHSRTGRVHTSFHMAGTATGRLSSSDPNLQNIPIRTEEGRRIRSAFVADDGCMLLSADYSQVELRVLAHLCQDPTLIAAFEADQDIHRIVAAEVFGVSADQVTPQQRSRAKTVNFGIIYGQTAYGLSLTLRIPRGEAKDFIERYRARFPRIEEFLQACIASAKANGYVETIFGRRRRIPEISTANPQRRALAERLAINSVVQGSAADLIKQAMINIAARIGREHRPSRMLLQIHDELVFEIPDAAVQADREMIVNEMQAAIKLRVPLKVEVGVGRNWMEAK